MKILHSNVKTCLVILVLLFTATQGKAQRRHAKTPSAVTEPVSGAASGYYTEPTPVPVEPVKEENKKLDEYNIKEGMDLLTLYRFIGNYLDSTRQIIRHEGESVVYQTKLKFNDAVETYIEANKTKGLLKAVFYRGTDKAAADSKYNELAEMLKRIKEESINATDEKYCDQCTGLAFRERINNESKPAYYWLQLVNKPDGVYEVQLIHIMYLEKYYFKESNKTTAAPPAAAPSTAETTVKNMVADMDANEAADKIVRAQALQTAVQEDFCTVLQRVVKQLPGDFETWKGLQKKEIFNMGNKSWYSKYMVKGSIYATIFDNFERSFQASRNGKINVNKYGWHCVLYDGPGSPTKIFALYQSYVSQLNSCALGCCTFTTSTVTEQNVGTGGQTTKWKVSSVQPGSNSKYNDMTMSISFSMNKLADTWYIGMWVE